MSTYSSADTTVLNAAALLAQYEISNVDLVQVREYGKVIAPKAPLFIDEFYGWLRTQPDFEKFFASEEKLAKVQDLQEIYRR